MQQIERDERGAERCRRVIKAAVPNVPNDPTRGYKTVEAYCNKPVLFSVEEKRKVCPDCDKQPPVGNVHPRTINAAGVVLTKKELEECGLTEDMTKIEKVEPAASEAPQAVEAKVEIKKDEVAITVTLADIEGNADIASLLIRRVSAGMDKLPVQNFGESKRLIKLQEKLEGLLRA